MQLVEAIDCGRGHVLALRATTELEVEAALKQAAATTDRLVFIECVSAVAIERRPGSGHMEVPRLQ